MPGLRRPAPTKPSQAFSKVGGRSEEVTCHRKTRPHMPRRAQRAASIGEATPNASHGRLQTIPKPPRKKRRLPAKAANQPSVDVQASLQPATDRLVAQRMIAKNERGHRFNDWHRSRKNARIMASARHKLALLLGTGDGFLLKRDGSGWLECHAKINFFTVADSALHASRIICSCPYFAMPHFKRVVVLRAAHSRRCKSRADLEAFCGRYAQHRFREVCFELVKNRLAESGYNATRHAFNHASD